MAHVCLPAGEHCDFGGAVTAIQWSGYACANDLHVDGLSLRESGVALDVGATYRITVNAPGEAVAVVDAATGAVVASAPDAYPEVPSRQSSTEGTMTVSLRPRESSWTGRGRTTSSGRSPKGAT